jgi:hypothetical protein
MAAGSTRPQADAEHALSATTDFTATHSVVRVASLDATAAALVRHGTSMADDDFMILRGGVRAVLISGPDGHRFLVAEAPKT